MRTRSFKVDILSTFDCYWDVIIDLSNGEKYIGTFSSLSKISEDSVKLNFPGSTVLIETLSESTVVEKIEETLKDDSFHTAFFPVNKRAINQLLSLVS